MNGWDIAQLVLGGVNLLFILKIVFNDLVHIRTMLFEHLRDHAKREFK